MLSVRTDYVLSSLHLLIRAEYLPYGSVWTAYLGASRLSMRRMAFAGQKDATVSLSDRHVPVPIGVSKVPEASGFVRGVAELGVVTVLGATFHEVNPVARGGLKLVHARQAPAQLA